jgi:Rad3-related DNA helicase
MPKTLLVEQRAMTKEEKHTFLNTFRGYKDRGAVLLGVITGNFGEGIDLPGDELQGVVVVGLPLSRPDLEVEALISYYDAKFGKGRDYGYLIPAFNKALQSAGRCIRSETDKGVVVFLDERYEDQYYLRLFPKDWRIKSTLLYEKMIREFFERNGK